MAENLGSLSDCYVTQSNGKRALAVTGGGVPLDVAIPGANSAFGDVSVSEFTPLTGWTFTYNINPALYKTTGNITNVDGFAVLQTGTASNGVAELETVRGSRYIPGVGGVARFTAIFDTPKADSIQIVGIGNGTDGWYFGYNGLQFGVLRRRDNVDYWTYQADWSEGAREDFNPQLGNVYQIKYQWLGFGMQYFGIENADGAVKDVHRISYSNTNTETSILNPNLPLTAKVENLGNTTNLTLKTPSAVAGLDGLAFNDAISTNVADDSEKSITSGTGIPILAFRLSDTYLGKANRLFCQALRLTLAADMTKPVTIRAYAGGTVTGGAWNYLSEQVSPLESNKTFTSYTPGLLVGTFPLGKTDSYQVSFAGTFFRVYAGQTIVLTANTTGSGDVVAGVNWKSFV